MKGKVLTVILPGCPPRKFRDTDTEDDVVNAYVGAIGKKYIDSIDLLDAEDQYEDDPFYITLYKGGNLNLRKLRVTIKRTYLCRPNTHYNSIKYGSFHHMKEVSKGDMSEGRRLNIPKFEGVIGYPYDMKIGLWIKYYVCKGCRSQLQMPRRNIYIGYAPSFEWIDILQIANRNCDHCKNSLFTKDLTSIELSKCVFEYDCCLQTRDGNIFYRGICHCVSGHESKIINVRSDDDRKWVYYRLRVYPHPKGSSKPIGMPKKIDQYYNKNIWDREGSVKIKIKEGLDRFVFPNTYTENDIVSIFQRTTGNFGRKSITIKCSSEYQRDVSFVLREHGSKTLRELKIPVEEYCSVFDVAESEEEEEEESVVVEYEEEDKLKKFLQKIHLEKYYEKMNEDGVEYLTLPNLIDDDGILLDDYIQKKFQKKLFIREVKKEFSL